MASTLTTSQEQVAGAQTPQPYKTQPYEPPTNLAVAYDPGTSSGNSLSSLSSQLQKATGGTISAGQQFVTPTASGGQSNTGANQQAATPAASVNYQPSFGGAQLGDAAQSETTGYQRIESPHSTAINDSRQLSENELSQNQLANMLSQDSTFMQAFKSQGERAAARRGLQNSSIANTSSLLAASQAATPFALQDASAYFQQGRANQDATNTAALQSRQFGQDASQLMTQQAQQTALANAQLEQQRNLTQGEFVQQAGLQGEELKQKTAAQSSAQEHEQSQLLSQQGHERGQLLTQQAHETNQLLTQQAHELTVQNDAQSWQEFQNNLQRAHEQTLTTLDHENQQTLQAMKNEYDLLISQNQTAATMYSETLRGITEINSNPNLGPGEKGALINDLVVALGGGLAVAGGLDNAELDAWLDSLGLQPVAQTGGTGGTGGGGGALGGGEGGALGGGVGGAVGDTGFETAGDAAANEQAANSQLVTAGGIPYGGGWDQLSEKGKNDAALALLGGSQGQLEEWVNSSGVSVAGRSLYNAGLTTQQKIDIYNRVKPFLGKKDEKRFRNNILYGQDTIPPTQNDSV